MWKCKHCNEEFDFEKPSQKASHTRKCPMNPKNIKELKQSVPSIPKRPIL